MQRSHSPVRVALIDDYEIVLAGLAHMLDRHRDRVQVIEIDRRARVDVPVDIALYDTFGQQEPEDRAFSRMVGNPRNRHVAVYTWSLQQDLIDRALAEGVSGYLSKGSTALALVDALERISAGETVVSTAHRRATGSNGLDWPGRTDGLSDREAEILAHVTQGRSNAEIATLTHLSGNTIKTHIRSAYRKVGVTNRVEAVLWGTDNGFRPDHRSVEHWLGGRDASHDDG